MAGFPGLSLSWATLRSHIIIVERRRICLQLNTKDMTKAIFLFFSSFFLILSTYTGVVSLSPPQQMVICLSFIFLIGIPHGAIDNVLFLREHKVSTFKFYLNYLGTIAANFVLWMFFPLVAYSLFIFISAYHFGESQFSKYFKKTSWESILLYTLWGSSILSGLIFFNFEEMDQLIASIDDFASFDLIHHKALCQGIFIGTTSGTIVALLGMLLQKRIGGEVLAIELMTIALIFLSFSLFPLLIGFTLYFVTLHSYKVLVQEYKYLLAQNIVRSTLSFVKLVLPFTLISVMGILGIFWLIQSEVIQMSYAYTLLVLISCITVPHAYVMTRFYKSPKRDAMDA